MKQVACSDGTMTLVDDVDYLDVLNRGTLHHNPKIGYAYFDRSQKRGVITPKLYLHIFICQAIGIWTPSKRVDHRNLDRLDNTRDNLRMATNAESVINQGLRSDNSSSARGVSWDQSVKKWRARINVAGVEHRLGYFDTLEEAKEVRRVAEQKHYGEFGRSDG